MWYFTTKNQDCGKKCSNVFYWSWALILPGYSDCFDKPVQCLATVPFAYTVLQWCIYSKLSYNMIHLYQGCPRRAAAGSLCLLQPEACTYFPPVSSQCCLQLMLLVSGEVHIEAWSMMGSLRLPVVLKTKSKDQIESQKCTLKTKVHVEAWIANWSQKCTIKPEALGNLEP